MKKIQKTNAMRFLDQHKVEYEAHTYEHKEGDPVDGVHVANMLHCLLYTSDAADEL